MAVPSTSVHAAAETFHYRFKGQFAQAFFVSTDPSGRVETAAFLFAQDQWVKTGAGRPLTESVASMFIDQFDVCTGTELLAAVGDATLAPEAFKIDRLNSATLAATIELFDFVSGTSFPVDVSASWTGFGDAFGVKDHFHEKTSGFKLNSRFAGTFRDAEAAATLTDGTTNFTPESAIFAEIGSVKVGEVAIIRA